MSRARTDEHRPSAIDPADYGYRCAFDTAGIRGATAARYEAALGGSATSVYRSPTRCEHCGTHPRYAVVYEHLPTGEAICTGITCAENTMAVPSRMALRVKRLRALTTCAGSAGGARRTPRLGTRGRRLLPSNR